MHTDDFFFWAAYADRARGFVRAVLCLVSWRVLLVAQAFGLTIGLLRWLEFRGHDSQAHLLLTSLSAEVLAALFVPLMALAGDEAVRRGWPVWRAFALAVLCAGTAVVLVQLRVRGWLGVVDPHDPQGRLALAVDMFVDMFTYWGMAVMVFLNRRSAARILAGVRTAELERVQLERRLITSTLAAAEAQIEPGSVLQRLARIRALYEAAKPAADEQLEALIEDLRENVRHSSAVIEPRGAQA
jgi:hypothetical protein